MTSEQSEAVSSRQGAWHQSTVDLIGNCSWRYFLTYKLGLPDPSGDAAKAGTAAHAAIEYHEKQRQATGAGASLTDLLAVAADGLDGTLVPVAHAAVKNWYQAKMKGGGLSHREWLAQFEPIAIEPYFRIPLIEDANPIGGWMDAVYKDPETGLYFVVDLKTAASFSRWKHDGEGKRHQATMYSIAVQLGDILPEKIDYLPPMWYTVVKSGTGGELARRVGPVQPDLEDVRVLGEKIRIAERVVANEEYVKNPAWVLCSSKWCPHYSGCMNTGELAGSPVVVRDRVSQNLSYPADNI